MGHCPAGAARSDIACAVASIASCERPVAIGLAADAYGAKSSGGQVSCSAR